jgi:hypothetical protein
MSEARQRPALRRWLGVGIVILAACIGSVLVNQPAADKTRGISDPVPSVASADTRSLSEVELLPRRG